jgi:hypothetical protein
MDLLHNHLAELLDTITQCNILQQQQYLQNQHYQQQQQQKQLQQQQQLLLEQQQQQQQSETELKNDEEVKVFDENTNSNDCNHLINSSLTNSGFIAASIPVALLTTAATSSIPPTPAPPPSPSPIQNDVKQLLPPSLNVNNNEQQQQHNLNMLANISASFAKQQQQQIQNMLITKLEETLSLMIQVDLK